MYKLVKPLFFTLEPETAHHTVTGGLRFFNRFWLGKQVLKTAYQFKHPDLQRKLWGITFPNPVGLAAGFDKNAEYLEDMAALGFGFIEIGTVTPRPQPGNDQPRMFRLPQDGGLINRMGFNNKGVDVAVENLKHFSDRKGLIVGGNIGKNKTTPNEEAVQDYLICFKKLFDWVDYFVVNVSSPNTPGLRALQEKGPLTEILQTLQAENQSKEKPKPILLKIAPDLSNPQLDDIVDIVQETGISGIIATNTTLSREGLQAHKYQQEQGGLSGKPLSVRSTEVIQYLHTRAQGAFPIIGVGGIQSPADALSKMQAGASLVQVYTGLIYQGPGMIKSICKRLVEKK